MKPKFLLPLTILYTVSAWSQITTISSPNFGGITTITPTYQGYSYTTIGGPRSGDFGSVQVTGGNVSGIAVGPRGGTYPIVTPIQLPSVIPDPAPQSISVPIYVQNKAIRNAKKLSEEDKFMISHGYAWRPMSELQMLEAQKSYLEYRIQKLRKETKKLPQDTQAATKMIQKSIAKAVAKPVANP